MSKKNRLTKSIDKNLEAFCKNPLSFLNSLKHGQPKTFHVHQHDWIFVSQEKLPESIAVRADSLSHLSIKSAGNAKTRKTMTPKQVSGALDTLDNTQAVFVSINDDFGCLVRSDVELIEPAIAKTFTLTDLRETRANRDKNSQVSETVDDLSQINSLFEGRLEADEECAKPEVELPAIAKTILDELSGDDKKRLETFITDRKRILGQVENGEAYPMPLKGKDYKIVLADDVPDDTKFLDENDYNVTGLNAEKVANFLTNVEEHNALALYGRNNIFAFVRADMPEKTHQAKHDVNLSDDEPSVDSAQDNTMREYKFGTSTIFTSKSHWKEFGEDPYDFVSQKRGVIPLFYHSKKQMIGFAISCEDRRITPYIQTRNKLKLNAFSKMISQRFSSNPYTITPHTVHNQGRGESFVFVPMGLALRLKENNFFDDAPEWVHDILDTAQEKKNEIDAEKVAKKEAKPSIASEDDVASEHAPIIEEIAEPISTPPQTEAVQPTEPEEAEEEKGLEEYNFESRDVSPTTIRSLQVAFSKARGTDELLTFEIEGQDIMIGRHADSIEQIEGDIDFDISEGIDTANVVTISFDKSSREAARQSMSDAYKAAIDPNNLVILQDSKNESKTVMTSNPDYVSAYQFSN